MPGFEPSTSVSRNRHSNNMTNMLIICYGVLRAVKPGGTINEAALHPTIIPDIIEELEMLDN